MEGRLLLKGCSVLFGDGEVRESMTIAVEHARIARIGPEASIPTLPGDWEVRCRGRLLTPGLTDCHARLASAQLHPKVPRSALDEPDLSLTEGELEALTLFALARALRRGHTCVIESLRAPRNVSGGLHAQRRAAEQLGIRLIHSHLSMGPGAEQLMEENAAYVEALRAHPLVRALIGVSADESAERVQRARSAAHALNTGVHVWATAAGVGHLAAHPLGAQSVVWLGDEVEAGQVGSLATAGLVAARGGGHLPGALRQGPCTEGVRSLWEGQGEAVDAFSRMWEGPGLLGAQLFGAPLGRIEEGALADLVVFDHVPANERGTALLWNQLSLSPVAWCVVGGRVTVREGQLLGVDYHKLARQAAGALRAQWARAGTA